MARGCSLSLQVLSPDKIFNSRPSTAVTVICVDQWTRSTVNPIKTSRPQTSRMNMSKQWLQRIKAFLKMSLLLLRWHSWVCWGMSTFYYIWQEYIFKKTVDTRENVWGTHNFIYSTCLLFWRKGVSTKFACCLDGLFRNDPSEFRSCTICSYGENVSVMRFSVRNKISCWEYGMLSGCNGLQWMYGQGDGMLVQTLVCWLHFQMHAQYVDMPSWNHHCCRCLFHFSGVCANMGHSPCMFWFWNLCLNFVFLWVPNGCFGIIEYDHAIFGIHVNIHYDQIGIV